MELVKLWALSDKLNIPVLQNLILQKINHISDETYSVSTHCLKYVYENSSEGSQLRRYFVEMVGLKSSEGAFSPRKEHDF